MTDDERRLFAALSVFPGSFTIQAASAVGDAVGVDASLVVPRLVRKSVVLADTAAGATRYRVLRTLRAFAAEQLTGDPQAGAAAREAFIDHFAVLARRWGRQQQTATVTAWLDELGQDTPNFQSASLLARSGDDLDRALLFVDVFQWYFNYVGQLAETRRWLAEIVAERDLTPEQRAIALVCQASLANFSGDYGATTPCTDNNYVTHGVIPSEFLLVWLGSL